MTKTRLRTFKGPLVETARREMQAIKVITSVGNEVIVSILNEPRLHDLNKNLEESKPSGSAIQEASDRTFEDL